MISAERLVELIQHYSPMGRSDELRTDTATALRELEAARTRIASLERDLARCNLSHDDLSVECQKLRAHGLSQEDREALERDAARYRWLRKQQCWDYALPNSNPDEAVIIWDRYFSLTEDAIDAAIDSATGGQTT